MPISKETRCSVLPKSQDLFHCHQALRNRLFLALFHFEQNKLYREGEGRVKLTVTLQVIPFCHLFASTEVWILT